MKYLIFIKGDGRGHITQAFALTQILTERGHTVCAYIVGCGPQTHLPDLLFDRATVPIEKIYSPNFAPDRYQKGISLPKTVLQGIRNSPAYRPAFTTISRVLQTYRPDVLINLFEPTITLYGLVQRHKIPVIHLAHQYLMLHRNFTFPRGRRVERSIVLNYTR